MRLPALLLALTLCMAAAACSRSDSDVQADLQKQLAADTATATLTATVTDGVARLSGVTTTKAQQDRALDIARSVKGVKEVQAAMRVEMKVRLQEALDTLDPADREILALRQFEGLTNREAAQVLGLGETAASQRYVRALQRLKKIFDSLDSRGKA